LDSRNDNLVEVGKLAGVFGIKGWVKVVSHTQPQENIFRYLPWSMVSARGTRDVEVEEYRPHGSVWIAKLRGVGDRNAAEALGVCRIFVDKDCFASLDDGDYYWHQLLGLRVQNRATQDLGVVSDVFETGANDVLVVAADDSSIDDRERLIPYVPGQQILKVDLEAGQILVDWDAEF